MCAGANVTFAWNEVEVIPQRMPAAVAGLDADLPAITLSVTMLVVSSVLIHPREYKPLAENHPQWSPRMAEPTVANICVGVPEGNDTLFLRRSVAPVAPVVSREIVPSGWADSSFLRCEFLYWKRVRLATIAIVSAMPCLICAENRPGMAAEPESSAEQEYRVTTPPAELKLAPFYKKYLNASGYPIVSSDKVNDYALREAAYLVDLMLSERPDLREAMITSGSRLIVIAHSEFTTDIPEYSHLKPKDYWDARARGLGGSREEAVCSCAEENVLAYEGDPYSTENILIHEFAHNIHYRGMIHLDPTFDDRLRGTYERAMAQGLWKSKYASVNPAEYFAEGVQSWFNNNRPPDHDHNHVDTREELREYDPGLASICEEVFGKTKLVYTKPTTRLEGHLADYNPEKSPSFKWPEKLAKMKQKIREDVKKRGDNRQQEYKN